MIRPTPEEWEGDGEKFDWLTSDLQGANWYWDSFSFACNKMKRTRIIKNSKIGREDN